VSFIPCSICARRNCGDLRHVYWFAPVRGADVLRVRQRLCPDCLAATVEALLTPPEAETLTCSACGISVEDDVFPIYLTWFPDKKKSERGAIALCEPHNVELRQRIQLGATVLPDRDIDPVDQVLAQPISAYAAFSALGRVDPGPKHPATH
jgi:hypothetical protein